MQSEMAPVALPGELDEIYALSLFLPICSITKKHDVIHKTEVHDDVLHCRHRTSHGHR